MSHPLILSNPRAVSKRNLGKMPKFRPDLAFGNADRPASAVPEDRRGGVVDRAEGGGQTRFFSSCMLSPRPRISFVSTSKLAGVPASRVFSPLTMLS